MYICSAAWTHEEITTFAISICFSDSLSLIHMCNFGITITEKIVMIKAIKDSKIGVIFVIIIIPPLHYLKIFVVLVMVDFQSHISTSILTKRHLIFQQILQHPYNNYLYPI